MAVASSAKKVAERGRTFPLMRRRELERALDAPREAVRELDWYYTEADKELGYKGFDPGSAGGSRAPKAGDYPTDIGPPRWHAVIRASLAQLPSTDVAALEAAYGGLYGTMPSNSDRAVEILYTQRHGAERGEEIAEHWKRWGLAAGVVELARRSIRAQEEKLVGRRDAAVSALRLARELLGRWRHLASAMERGRLVGDRMVLGAGILADYQVVAEERRHVEAAIVQYRSFMSSRGDLDAAAVQVFELAQMHYLQARISHELTAGAELATARAAKQARREATLAHELGRRKTNPHARATLRIAAMLRPLIPGSSS